MTKPAPHTEGCRKQMYEELAKTDKGKKWMEKAETKIDEYLESKVKESDERAGPDDQNQGGRKELFTCSVGLLDLFV